MDTRIHPLISRRHFADSLDVAPLFRKFAQKYGFTDDALGCSVILDGT
jgi:hypothetical protein